MLSSMAPTIVTGPDGKVILVAGAAGGPTIITSVFLELSNTIDFGLDVGAAVNAPRFHMQHLPTRWPTRRTDSPLPRSRGSRPWATR